MTWIGFGLHPVIWPWCVGLVGGLTLLVGLAVWLDRRPAPSFWPPRRVALIGATWSLICAALWYALSAPFTRDLSTAIGFAVAAWWLLWVWMMFLVGGGWPKRLGILAASLGVVALFLSGVKANGWDGASRPEIVWRFLATADPVVRAEPAPRLDAAPPTTVTGDYPRFRGADGLATVPLRLARDWSRDKPALVWRHAVGAAWSAMAVAGDQAITQEQRDDDECVVCYDRQTGTERWVHRDPAHYRNAGTGDGPRATPTIDGPLVFTLGATGILNGLDRETGQVRWTTNILTDNEAQAPGHGTVGSPLVVGQHVIVCAGGSREASVVAYDKATGKRAWGAGSDPAGYTSPFLLDHADGRQILAISTQSLTAHDPQSGEILWSFPWHNDQSTNCSQPLPFGEQGIFVSANYGLGCALVEATRDSEGKWEARPRWTSRTLQTKFCSAVIHDGHAYSLDDEILECVSLADGRRRWKRGRYGHGQLLLAGDVLLIQAEDGRVVLVEATPAEHRELAAFQAIDGKTWNNPALAGRQLFVRNDREAACYELPLESPADGSSPNGAPPSDAP